MDSTPPPDLRAAWEAEALRLNDRYLREVIERHNFCPYARVARETGRMRRYVRFEGLDDVAPVLALMAEIAADPGQEVVQVIFPALEVEAGAWRTHVMGLEARLVAEHGERHRGVLAAAAFHPQASFLTRSAAALVPLFRRAPDPTIQWTRLDVLQRVSNNNQGRTRFLDLREADLDALVAQMAQERPPLSERIAQANLETACALGVARVLAELEAIAEEGRAAYARLRAGGGGRPAA